MSLAPELDLDLVTRVEAQAVNAWPASICEPSADGWVLRSTPGLDRGRSNHALTPCRELSAEEISAGIAQVETFARRHGIRAGIQLSPIDLHRPLLAELQGRGWSAGPPALVMTAPIGPFGLGAGPLLKLEETSEATPDWLAAWAACEPGRDVDAHAKTVFAGLRKRARFVRCEQRAVGIAVPSGGLIGLFCLAVAPDARRGGVGSALVRTMLTGRRAELAYLQVEEVNVAARALYERLGFVESYRYVHCSEPD